MPLDIIDEIRSMDKERASLREKVLFWLGVLCLLVLVGLATNAYAGPMAQTVTEDGAKIVLTDEPCKLDAVTNLKHRATWTEKGKVFEGCYGVHPAGVVLGYFADKTVVLIPMQMFTKVSGA